MHLNLWHAEVGLHYERLTAQTEIKDSLMHMRFQTCWLASPLHVWALCSGVQKKAQSCTCLLMRSPNRHALPQHGVEHLSPGSALVHVLLYRHSLHRCFLRVPSAEG